MKYLKNIALLTTITLLPANANIDVASNPTPSIITTTNNQNSDPNENIQDCHNACSNYEKGINESINTTCGTDPNATNIVTSTNANFAKYSDCSQSIRNALSTGPLPTHCTSLKLIQKDMDLEAASVGLFTVAAATCLAACYFGLGGAVSPLLSAACTATGITATGLDIASSITIEKEAEVYENVLLGESIATSVTGGVGSATAFVATGFAFKKDPSFGEKFTHAIKTGSNKVKGYLNMKKPAENAAEATNPVDNPPTEDTAEPTKNAEPTTEKPKADTRDKALICGSAFLLAATSAIKGAAFAKLKDSKKASCAIIRKLKDYGSFKPNNPGSTPPPGEATGGSLDIAAGSTSKTGSDRNQEKDAQDNPLPNPPSLAAMAANTPLSNNLDPLRNLAEEQKAPIAAATSALQNGASPTSALHTAIPDLPKEVDQALNTMHQMAKDGILTMEKNPANFQGNDKKNLSAESSDSTFNRSFTPKTGPASTKTLSFLNKNITKKPSSTDIWHTHEKITIFAIVSQRLESSQDKVETLPWVSPLNKALQMKLLDQKK